MYIKRCEVGTIALASHDVIQGVQYDISNSLMATVHVTFSKDAVATEMVGMLTHFWAALESSLIIALLTRAFCNI